MVVKRFVVLLALAAVGLASCSADATDGERAVCDQLQGVIALLEQNNRAEALDGFLALHNITARSGNEAMQTEGQGLFDVLTEPVEGAENMTVKQTTQFADAALARSSVHLDAIVAACDAVGQSIEVNNPGALVPDR
jgi:hypothetical protein